MKIHIEIPTEVKQKIDLLRSEQGLSLNWIVNRAIINYLKIKLDNCLRIPTRRL